MRRGVRARASCAEDGASGACWIRAGASSGARRGPGRIRLAQQQQSARTRGHHTQAHGPAGADVAFGAGAILGGAMPESAAAPTLQASDATLHRRLESLVESLILAQDQRWRRA